ncbi:MAG: hypothetical protein WCP12_05810 [bacterium]
MTGFNYKLADSQATVVTPMGARDFPFAAYADYEAEREARCKAFWNGTAGVLVYRRMRVAEVFSYGCRDMKASLSNQLGALAKSMAYEADIPNFLEPWYGIGTIASAFGTDYHWEPGQSPSVCNRLGSVGDVLNVCDIPVAETAIGQQTLAMIRYFLDETQGRLPMSFTDTQSALNIAGGLMEITTLLMEMMDDPEAVRQVLKRAGSRLVEFTELQRQTIGAATVYPGHGFASSREFSSLGISDDNVLMVGSEMYREIVAEEDERDCASFGGVAFHSCGDWSSRIPMVKTLKGLRVVDAAFGAETDPSPNPPEVFSEAFANTNIVLNARIVGNADTVEQIVRRLWRPGMKLIVVTYCATPEEQADAYQRIHAICRG